MGLCFLEEVATPSFAQPPLPAACSQAEGAAKRGAEGTGRSTICAQKPVFRRKSDSAHLNFDF